MTHLTKIAIAALVLVIMHPNLSFAAVAGMPCEKSEVGKTEMDDNKKNIIGCLITDDGKSQVWKNFGGNNKSFSLTCDDWNDSGWSSKDDCIMDGRWHLVYSNNSSGGAAYGSVGDLVKYVRNGADAKSITSSSTGGSHNCDAIAWAGNVVACMDTISVAGDSFASSSSLNDGTYYAGSALRRTDGIKVNTNIVPSNTDGNMLMQAFMKSGKAAMDWYVRF